MLWRTRLNLWKNSVDLGKAWGISGESLGYLWGKPGEMQRIAKLGAIYALKGWIGRGLDKTRVGDRRSRDNFRG
jgi:hypothetical protein